MIAIVDYKVGNVKAFANVYRALDIPFVIAENPGQLAGASKLILPGVGAFDQTMRQLNASGMRDTLDEMVLGGGIPVLGVCVGMQMLARSSDEGDEPGLGWVDGRVVKFRSSPESPLAVPHMGWNDVHPCGSHALFDGLEEGARFYFLHSYFFKADEASKVLATSVYGESFACAVGQGTVFGVQFHPEKSHGWGARLLRNFADC
jgi:glutamine amidotransferase